MCFDYADLAKERGYRVHVILRKHVIDFKGI